MIERSVVVLPAPWRRILGHGHRDLEQALVAVRQRGGQLFGPVDESEQTQAVARALRAGLEDGPAAKETKILADLELDGDADVLQHRELREDAGDLEGAPAAAAAARRCGARGDVVAAEEHA